MEAGVSLVMANMAKAGPGKIIYDPFVGTGSMLYTAAHFGAYVFGSDIDGRYVKFVHCAVAIRCLMSLLPQIDTW